MKKIIFLSALIIPMLSIQAFSDCYEHSNDQVACMQNGNCTWYPGGQECVGEQHCYGSDCTGNGCFWSHRPDICAPNLNKK